MESKKKHLRKLLQLNQAPSGDRELIITVQNATSSASSSSSSSTPPSPSPLVSSMAFTLFVLLIALFFTAFFFVFIRHFADDDSTAEISSRPRRRTSSSTTSPRQRFSSRRKRGLDSQAVRSLPVHRYTKAAKQRIEDCVICLSDFQEGETVKVIPHCGHMFHVDCVDTWLSSHASCPFCRSSHVLPEHDTCADVGPCMRRCSSSSYSNLGQRTTALERSLSL
ncbi:unnamed protein product [Thlaspi arvense]|uniref:RING-type E3 ubiquitin transferase n=1 Tax=Thlaspi arvense TaxID=13288 RepID=A0AAU9SDX0_THLAR|nr:unnamed protein product [Thlaspi arvense]